MNGKFRTRPIVARGRGAIDPQEIAIRLFGAIAADPERLGRFLAMTGLQPGGMRDAARSPGFLAAVVDHVAGDETLLVALTGELALPPESVLEAQFRLSPPPEDV